MLHQLKIFILLLLGGILCSAKAFAFFPIPVPLIGTDVANNTMDLGENLNAIGEQVEQVQTTIEKTREEIKSGSFGFDAIKGYTESLKAMDIKKMVPELKLPKQLAPLINKADAAAAAANALYANTYSEKGNHMEQAKINNRKRTELLQMNVAAMYAHALAARVHLAKERELPEVSLENKNTRELIQANRALSEKMAKRWNDILFMESQITEYRSTQILTGFVLTAQQAAERGITEDKNDTTEGEGK